MRVLSKQKTRRLGYHILLETRKNSGGVLSRCIQSKRCVNTRCIVPSSGTCSRWGNRRACSDRVAFRIQGVLADGRAYDDDLSKNEKGNESNARTTIGIVVVDHGSKRESSNVMLDSFVQLYKGMLGEEKIEMNIVAIEKAHMEIASPSVKDAVGACVDKGAKVVVVAPYFLSRGRHILEDIPALVEEAQAEYKDVKCVMADPIGLDVRVADVVHSRVEEVLTALEKRDLEM
eukprot:jgi/Picsp_1/914/NSC_04399-R1_sirohydrochlorin ferrochelatase